MSFMRALIDRRVETIGAVSISQDPGSPLLAALGGTASTAGVTVTAAAAEGVPAVFACDLVIKRDVAKTPIKLMRRLEKGKREPDTNHPVYALLHDLPNPVMDDYEFKETMQSWLNRWGAAFAVIDRDARNMPKALWPLESDRMTLDLDGANRLRYRYRMADGRTKDWFFNAANPPILHLRQNALDGVHGRSPIAVLREFMGTAIAEQRYRARWYGQGGHARIALSTPQGLKEEAAKRIRHDFEAMTRGEENWHRAIVMDHDLKPVPLAMPHRDAQFVEDLKLTRSQIAGMFRVPAHKINDLEKATFSNIEHSSIEWVTDGLMPHFVTWQKAIARDLLNPKSFNTHFAVFVVDALVRGDFKTQMEALHLQRQDGIINGDEWRNMLDMNPIEDGSGKDYLINGNMVPLRTNPAAVLEGA